MRTRPGRRTALDIADVHKRDIRGERRSEKIADRAENEQQAIQIVASACFADDTALIGGVALVERRASIRRIVYSTNLKIRSRGRDHLRSERRAIARGRDDVLERE